MTLQPPQLLVRLPKSLKAEGDGPFAAGVYTLVAGKKRKRSELAVAVHGEAINVYDIESAKIATSYSVSSQVSFTCAPCSLRQKYNSRNQRLTFCSVVDPTPRIQCFTEASGQSSGSPGKITTASREIRDSSSPVVFLETVKEARTGEGASGSVLLVIHEDGEMRCLSVDLSEKHWQFKPPSTSTTSTVQNTKILQAAMLSLDEARKGFLKNRADVLARLTGNVDVSGSEPTAPDLLVVLMQSGIHVDDKHTKNLAIKIYSVCGSLQSRTSTLKASWQNVEELITLPLPETDVRHSNSRSYLIHKASGTLYHCAGKSLRVYDFASTVPHLASHLQLKQRIQSCLRVSSSAVIITTLSSITIIDIKHQSLLATASISLASEDIGASPISKKAITRKESTQLLAYYTSLGTVIAVRGRNLISYQTTDVDSTLLTNRKRYRSGRLVDAIGQGLRHHSAQSSTHAIGSFSPGSSTERLLELAANKKWEEAKAKLDIMVSQNNLEEFDSFVLEELELDGTGKKNDTINSTAYEGPKQKPRISRPKLMCLINSILKMTKEPSSADSTSPARSFLSIKVIPTRTFHWLIENNCFCTQFIESALKQKGSLDPAARLPIQAVVQALAIYDTSFQSLLSYLASSTFLSPREIIYAVRLAIEKLQLREAQADQKLLTNGVDAEMTNGDFHQISASNELDKTSTNANQIIKHSLRRLHHHHESEIRKALKAELSPKRLLSFVDFLRIELARGGWLSRYTDDESLYHNDQGQQDSKMSIATKFISCAIDCLGTGTWITASSNNGMADDADTIAYMKAEVSAALEGIEEAAYLKAMLNEVLLYSKTMKTRHLEPTGNGTDVSTMTKPTTIVVKSWQDNVLPIGLKADQGIGTTKIGAGGEIQERNMRDIGRLKSQKVGVYSFERILI